MRRVSQVFALFTALLLSTANMAAAQGVTTGSMNGAVVGPNGPLAAARVSAVHVPSGTVYSALTRSDGRFTIPGMRVGGPYTVSAIALGFQKTEQLGINVSLGSATSLTFDLKQAAVQLTGVEVVATQGALASNRTGASTTISREALAAFPTIGRTITDFTRLTPQSSGSSFAGQDNRMNNITLDGSSFNNSFGLGSQPGGRTGVSPIPIDAIEEIQVNIAPYDVRQGNFTGAGVNAVTKSGTNDFRGSLYYTSRSEKFVGDESAGLPYNKGVFSFSQPGGYLSGPIIKNKMFFFLDYETDELSAPASGFTANTGAQPVAGNVTRVLKSDLDGLSSFLSDKFGFVTGPYENFNLVTPSTRYIAKVDYNLNDRNKFSFRYSQLNSSTDNSISNSTSLGFGNRRDNPNSMSYQNSGYSILENIKSYIGELNSQIGSNKSNQIIAGFTKNDESRGTKSPLFPLIDIKNGSSNYISAGFEPFTPNNELRYQTWQFQDNFSIYTDKHDYTIGVTAQKYNSENVFFSGSQGVFVYNSLADFYTDANDYLANPNRTISPVTLDRYQVRYSNIPGQTKPVQPLEVYTYGAYAQDDWRATQNLKVTYGLRLDVPIFSNTAYANPVADALTFRDETGAAVKYSSGKLPDANILFSPRLGFNWDMNGDRSTVVRGGTGIFSGTPPYVWISNQIGQTGILTGFDDIRGKNTRPFNPNVDAYKPTNVTGASAASFELDVTDPGYKFAQVWRSNIAVDHQLPWGVLGTLEGLYSTEMNGPYYINANLPAAQSAYTGVDDRKRWTSNRINSNITNAFVISNSTSGYSYNIAASLTKDFNNGFFAKTAYAFGETKNSFDPGSTASSNFGGNQQSNDPNNPGVGISNFSPRHRVFLALSYKKDYFNFGATTVSLFTEGRSQGTNSYIFSSDANGDGQTNDLIYVPASTSEMVFQEYGFCLTSGTYPNNCVGGVRTFTVAEQTAAWEAFITQDPYLSKHRGEYAARNGINLPVNFRSDLGITQEIYTRAGGKKNTLSLRLDILNVDNLINKAWGAGDRLVYASSNGNATPLVPAGVDANGALRYRMRNIGTTLPTTSYQKSAGLGDVWRMQLGVRYTFN